MSEDRRRVPPPPAPGSDHRAAGDIAQHQHQHQQQQPSYDMLQMKYLTVDRNYETLKQLTRKGKKKKIRMARYFI